MMPKIWRRFSLGELIVARFGLEAGNLASSVEVNHDDLHRVSGSYRAVLIICMGCLTGFAPARSEPLDEWHWRNPLPQGNGLTAVAFGSGLFVAVGPYGTVLTSSDGLHWTQQDSEVLRTFRLPGTVPKYLSDVTYGGGLFVAVGGSGETQGFAMSSHDGVNWDNIPLSGARLFAVTYAKGRFIAVGTRGKGFTSSDGLSWIPMDTGYDRSRTGITFGHERWLAIGGGSVVSSDDGLNWNVLTNGPGIVKVAYGNNLFVGVTSTLDGGGYNIATSPDGVSWTWRRSGEVESLPGIAYANGQFLALGVGAVLTAADGVNWTRHNTGILGGFYGAAAGAGRYVAVGGHGAIVSSSDGLTWSAVSQGPIDTLRGVTFAGDQFVAVGGPPFTTANNIFTSPDGVAWNSRPGPAGQQLNSIAQGAGTYVSVGGDGTIVRSTDGVSWSLAESPTSNTLFAVTYANDQFVAVGRAGTVVSSPDGSSWTPQLALTQGHLRAVTYGGSQFVAVGWQGGSDPRGLIVTSADGTLWEALDPSMESGGEFRGVAYGNGRFVAVGAANLATSSDGVTWIQQRPAGASPGWSSAITFVEGQFVVPSGGKIWTSPDGESWRSHDQPAGRDLNAVVAGADTVVVVGSGGTILQSGFLTRPTLSRPLLTDGAFELFLTAKTGRIFRIQATSDLTQPTWIDLGFVTNTLGEVKFTDSGGAAFSSRFYRALSLP